MPLKRLIALPLIFLLISLNRIPTAPIGNPAAPPDQTPEPTAQATGTAVQPDSLPPIGSPWTAAGENDSGYCPLLYGYGWNGSLEWPVPGYAEFRPFGFEPGGRHVGIDIYADEGAAVVSPVTGVIVWAGYSGAGFGEMIAVASSGRVVILAHLSAVAGGLGCGDGVTAGDLVGYVGRTGAVAGRSHLHLEIRWDGMSWNPALWLP